MEYNITLNNDPHKMAKSVNELCKDGWEPYGSPMVAFDSSGRWYHYQAIIRNTQSSKVTTSNVSFCPKCKIIQGEAVSPSDDFLTCPNCGMMFEQSKI